MKKITFAALILFTLTLLISFTKGIEQTTDYDLLWKARALKAAEKIQDFLDTYKDEKIIPKKIKYQMMVEAAYGMIIKEPDICIKKTPSGVSYHLVFNFGEERGLLDVLYTYDKKTQKLFSSGIDRLPKGYRLLMANEMQGYFSIINMDEPNAPSFLFSQTDPFSVVVMGE